MSKKKFYPHSPPRKPYKYIATIPEYETFKIEGAETFTRHDTIVLSRLHPECKELYVGLTYEDGDDVIEITQYGGRPLSKEDIEHYKGLQDDYNRRYEKELVQYKIDKKEWDAQMKIYKQEQEEQKKEYERKEYERLKAKFESKEKSNV